MQVIYSIRPPLHGGGIGSIGYYGALGLFRNGSLRCALSQGYAGGEIPSDVVRTFPLLAPLDKGLGFLRNRVFSAVPQYAVVNNLFDALAARHVAECDLFYGWMGMSLRQMRTAKERGATTVIECASSHPTYQRELLREEYDRWGADVRIGSERVYRQSLQELEEADYIKIPSDFVRESFLQQGVAEEKLIQVPFGVDLERFSPESSEDGVFRALFVGTVGLRKGVQYLLQAWDELGLAGAELYILGSETADIRRITAEYKGRDDIIFTGHTDPQPYFQQADAFVFPSIEEGSALVTYEAMASGLPSVVTPNCGSLVRDGKDGFVVPIRSPEAIAEKLKMLADDPEVRARMGRSARERITEYTWERHGKELYARCADKLR